MRRLALLAITLFAYSSVATSETVEKCFPWNATLQQGDSAELNLGAEMCYAVPKNEDGIQKFWGSSVSSEAEAFGRLFDNDLQLAHWMGGIKLSNEGSAAINAEVLVAGQEVLNRNFLLEEVAVKRNMQLLGFEQNVARRVMIGVIPATVSLGVITDGYVDMVADVRKTEVGFGVNPTLDANAYAKAGFGNDVVFIGFSGGVELVDEELEFRADMLAPKAGENIKIKMIGKNSVKALKGAIDASIKVSGNKVVRNIASFNGMERDDTIVDKTFEIE
jgi:hypothetical protein